MKLKSCLAFFLCTLLLFTTILPVSASQPSREAVNTILSETAATLEKTPATVGSIGGEWAILGLARSGLGSASYFEAYRKTLRQYVRACDGVLHKRKYTEYARVTLALTVLGENPEQFAGYDIAACLGDTQKILAQGTSAAVWALVALDGADLSEQYAAAREVYLDKVLSSARKDGGFSLTDAVASDTDLTAMALIALAPYGDRESIKAAVQNGFDFLSRVQLADGGFATAGKPTAESTAQVLTALCTYGISVEDERFVKNGHTVLEALLQYHTPNGFHHTMDDTSPNAMATEQSFYALTAYTRACDGKKALFDLSDAAENINATAGAGQSGSGLAGKDPAISSLPVRFPEKTFADIAAHPDKRAIEALTARGILNGRNDTTFDPNGKVTRAEFCAMTVRALGMDAQKSGAAPFDDVEQNAWYAPFVNTAYAYGIVNGLSEHTFAPGGSISREQALVMLSHAAGLCGLKDTLSEEAVRMALAPFSDASSISTWAKNETAFCLAHGIYRSEEAFFQPTEAESRAGLATMLFGLLNAADLL